MAREQFIDSLRYASRMMSPPLVYTGQGKQIDNYDASRFHSADLWLTPKSVEGFDPSDFSDLAQDQLDELAMEVQAFLDIALKVPGNKPATKSQSQRGRKHLERAIQIVREQLLREWLDAQKDMMDTATAAAQSKGWYVDKDDKEVSESLLGSYRAPRLRIRTPDREIVLDPIARFGSGRQGVVDLVIMPTYETVYLIVFKEGVWQIVSTHGTAHRRAFNRTTLVNTITKLSHP